MNFPWLGAGGALPIVEFHDVRTEAGATDRYMSLTEGRLGGPLLAAGGAPMGHFRVRNHPGRLMLLRGFAGTNQRREALTAFHAGAEWRSVRAEAMGLVRDTDVSLTRAVTPAAGVGGLRPGSSYQLLVSELRFAEQLGGYHLWLRLFLRKAGLDPIAAFATLESANDVPAVPVIRNRTQHFALLRDDRRVPDLPRELRGMLRFAPEALTLEPTPALVW